MEPASTSKTQVNFYQITRPYNPEDRHLQREVSLFPVNFADTNFSFL
jgi:hypothetical protein